MKFIIERSLMSGSDFVVLFNSWPTHGFKRRVTFVLELKYNDNNLEITFSELRYLRISRPTGRNDKHGIQYAFLFSLFA